MKKTIHRLARIHQGADIFVLGNGPSVTSHDLNRLSGRLVIGMNGSTLLESQCNFHSQYYVLSDARFLNNPEKRSLATSQLHPSTVRVLRAELAKDDEAGLPHETHLVKALGKNGFSHDLARGYFFGCTTTMLAIHLAAFLGARRIILLGVDFRYGKEQRRFYSESAPDPVDPFLSIQLWNIHNAVRELSEVGVDVVMCTRHSNLAPYVPWVEFESIA